MQPKGLSAAQRGYTKKTWLIMGGRRSKQPLERPQPSTKQDLPASGCFKSCGMAARTSRPALQLTAAPDSDVFEAFIFPLRGR